MLNKLRAAFPKMDWRQVEGKTAFESPMGNRAKMVLTLGIKSNTPSVNGWLEGAPNTRIQQFFQVSVEVPTEEGELPWVTAMETLERDPVKAIKKFQQHFNDSNEVLSLVNASLAGGPDEHD